MNALEIARWKKPQKCPYPKCKKQFEDGIIELQGKYGKNLTWKPNGKFLFHYYDTHGFPAEMMTEELDKLINRPMSQAEIDYYNESMKKAIHENS